MSASVPVQQGLFTDTDPPHLLGGRCTVCGHPHFPRHDICPYCSSGATEAALLSSAGHLWAWTAVTHPPPGYQGPVPYGFGVVELPEGLRVITRLTEADPDTLRAGQPMHMVLEPLHTDEEGRSVVGYAFAPDEAP
ncbi:MAG TPA: OB-fold domain-containing protein [Acidimicrobiales bacterium]|nr:OB-fold domain-containing protein [Acidimicrobiales bacterium]